MNSIQIAFTGAVVLSLASGAGAQAPATTRAEAQRQEREQKQKELEPNEPDRLQRALNYAENRALFLMSRDGFVPKLGSLTTGSGFSFGLGYRDRDIFAHQGALELWGAGSFKRYWAVEARTSFPDLAGGHVMAEVVGGLREYPQESFFGLGPDSQRSDRTSFLLRTAHVSGRAGVRPVRPLLFGGEVGLVRPRTGSGTNTRLPSIATIFTPAQAPGLGVDVDFLQTSGFVEVDYREPVNARRGGLYRFKVGKFSDRDDRWSFRRTEVDLQQFIGFFADRRVIALRGFLSTSTPTDGSAGIPFYMMPTLGGNESLRGFRNYRFRGPHSLLLQAEYRWELWSGLDAALFYDAGMVGTRRSDLKLRRLEKDYGFGFRFNTSNGVIMRVDAAFGSTDGKHLHIVFGGVF
ncbi:MAG: BamA/TamA family outer membrane protein [Acidobacteriota bacterium]